LRFTLVAFNRSPENFMAAIRADVAGFFILNPFFSAHLAPMGNRPQDYFFADRHGKIFDMPARKFIALMAAGVSFLFSAVPDPALLAMHKRFFRQTTAALNIIYGHTLAVREGPFAGDTPFVQIQ
jgi:hypothetical protein